MQFTIDEIAWIISDFLIPYILSTYQLWLILVIILLLYRRNARERGGWAGLGPRYKGYLRSWQIPIALLILVSGYSIYRPSAAKNFLLSAAMTFWVEFTIGYILLVPLIHLLRRRYQARTCVMLWELPGYIGLTMLVVRFGRPWLILTVPKGVLPVLTAIWAVGFVAVLGWNIRSHLRFRRQILADSRGVSDDLVARTWREAKKAAEMESIPCELMVSSSISTPLTIGCFRATQVLLLPDRLYTAEELELIFRHELIHIGRKDSLNKLFYTGCCAFSWFNPLVWLGLRRCREDIELSCDETVLLGCDDSTRHRYAKLLLTTVGEERGYTTCLSASASALRYRLKSVMENRNRRMGALWLCLLALVLCIFAGRVVLAYEVSGQEAIFFGESTDNFHRNQGAWGDEDFSATKDYLAGLQLRELTTRYTPSNPANSLNFMMHHRDGWNMYVTLKDDYLLVNVVGGPKQYVVYQIMDEVDYGMLNEVVWQE